MFDRQRHYPNPYRHSNLFRMNSCVSGEAEWQMKENISLSQSKLQRRNLHRRSWKQYEPRLKLRLSFISFVLGCFSFFSLTDRKHIYKWMINGTRRQLQHPRLMRRLFPTCSVSGFIGFYFYLSNMHVV